MFAGSSAAAPHVSGVIAHCLHSGRCKAKDTQAEILRKTMRYNKQYPGYGISNPTRSSAYLMDLMNKSYTYFGMPMDPMTLDFLFHTSFPKAYFTTKKSYGELIVGVDSFYS